MAVHSSLLPREILRIQSTGVRLRERSHHLGEVRRIRWQEHLRHLQQAGHPHANVRR